MQCKNCGCEVSAGDQFCPGCGKNPAAPLNVPPPDVSISPKPTTEIPIMSAAEFGSYDTTTDAPAPPKPAPAPAPPPPPTRTMPPTYAPGAPMPAARFQPPAAAVRMPPVQSGKALASLICSIVSLGIGSIAAVILGHMALSEIKRSGGQIVGRGLAIAGLILGYLGIAIPVIGIAAAIIIPNVLVRSHGGTGHGQSSAVASLRTITSAENTFSYDNPRIGYTCDLQVLQGKELIDSTLASGNKLGYKFELSGCQASSNGIVQLYQVTATPTDPSVSGERVYCSDQGGVIRYDDKGSATDCLISGTAIE